MERLKRHFLGLRLAGGAVAIYPVSKIARGVHFHPSAVFHHRGAGDPPLLDRALTCSVRVWCNHHTGSITPFGAGQKVNIIVTLVEIMITFCELQNVIRI